MNEDKQELLTINYDSNTPTVVRIWLIIRFPWIWQNRSV